MKIVDDGEFKPDHGSDEITCLRRELSEIKEEMECIGEKLSEIIIHRGQALSCSKAVKEAFLEVKKTSVSPLREAINELEHVAEIARLKEKLNERTLMGSSEKSIAGMRVLLDSDMDPNMKDEKGRRVIAVRMNGKIHIHPNNWDSIQKSVEKEKLRMGRLLT